MTRPYAWHMSYTMQGCVDVGVVGLYMLWASEQLQEARSPIGMMSGMGSDGSGWVINGSVGNAAQMGGGTVT